MIMARDSRHRNWVTNLCRAHGFEPKVSQQAGDMIAGVAMASTGFGVQIVPDSAQALKLPGLVYRPLESRIRSHGLIELQCAYLKGERSPLLQRLLRVVREFRTQSRNRQGSRRAVPTGKRSTQVALDKAKMSARPD
jgi:DNA-binding transcriptional LysR family regulator